jgi:non-reducing end alpha-L-arabinofuranosidase
MLTVEFLRRTNVALVVLTGVACTKIIGLPDLPELGGGGSSGRNGQGGGAGQAGSTVSSGGKSANGGAAASGGSSASAGSDVGGEAGSSSGASGLGGAGGMVGGAAGGGGTVSSGGSSATGGSAGDGGSGPGGSSGAGGSGVGGTSGAGGSAGGGASGASGAGGMPAASDGPCDIYAAADTPCVGAYSTIRRLSKTYTGPLYQVRSGSSAQNTGEGGVVHDIEMTTEGFADAAGQDAACGGSICTISLLYDQSGNDNHLSVAKKGSPAGSPTAAEDDYESIADEQELTLGDHRVYALYMKAHEGYRLPAQGNDVPVGTAAQGVYMLADGARVGTQCCWEFGNVGVDPTVFTSTNSLFLGVAYWGHGDGAGPWFMADFGNGIWAGGSMSGDPGWGHISDTPGPANTNNPSLRVPFALGFLKTNSTQYVLRMADAQTANVSTAYQGNLPLALDNQGAIVLGVGADNSNNSFGTFYEGAVLSGFPTDAAELDVLENIRAAGYGE